MATHLSKLKKRNGDIILPVTRSEGVILDDGSTDLQTKLDSLDAIILTTKKEITLLSSSWSSYYYTINDILITSTSYQEIFPSPSINSTQLDALQKANIIDGGQISGSMTLKAFGTVPTIDIPIIVIYRGEK